MDTYNFLKKFLGYLTLHFSVLAVAICKKGCRVTRKVGRLKDRKIKITLDTYCEDQKGWYGWTDIYIENKNWIGFADNVYNNVTQR